MIDKGYPQAITASLFGALTAAPLATYIVPLSIMHTGAPVGGTVVWSLKNGATQKIVVRDCHIVQGFHGTAVGASGSPAYSLRRYTGGPPTGGGTTDPVLLDGSTAHGIAEVRSLHSGLTVPGGMTLGVAASLLRLPIVSTFLGIPIAASAALGQRIVHAFDLGLALDANDGALIQLETAGIDGLSLSGHLIVEVWPL